MHPLTRPRLSVALVAVATLAPLALISTAADASSSSATRLAGPSVGLVGPAANPKGVAHSLDSVSAVAPDDIWAVGVLHRPAADQTWTTHFDGTRWRHVPSFDTAHRNTVVQGVYAAGPNDVWAVGTDDDQGPSLGEAFIMHWDGTGWSQATYDEPGDYSTLYKVTGTGPDDVYAVGQVYDADSGDHGLLMHFDGTSWARLDVPRAPGESLGGFENVTALSPTDIWAVGYALYGSSQSYQPLIAHYDGSSWTFPALPPSTDGYVWGVSGTGTKDVWAVGIVDSGESYGPLAYHWNGKAWQSVSAPAGPGDTTYLEEAAAVSHDDAWAVGLSHAGRQTHTLIEHWDGAAWTIVDSPNAFPKHNALYAVTALSADDVHAVGAGTIHHKGRTLTAHWDGTSWSLGG